MTSRIYDYRIEHNVFGIVRVTVSRAEDKSYAGGVFRDRPTAGAEVLVYPLTFERAKRQSLHDAAIKNARAALDAKADESG